MKDTQVLYYKYLKMQVTVATKIYKIRKHTLKF